MDPFLRRAEEILDVAICGAGQDVAIAIEHGGCVRLLDPAGWSLEALSAECGATAVYKVQRRGQTIRVEGWGRGQRCLLQRSLKPNRLQNLPGMATFHHPHMLQLCPPSASV